jgi:hypothetical protein
MILLDEGAERTVWRPTGRSVSAVMGRPVALDELRGLLTDGCDGPRYNRHVHVSEFPPPRSIRHGTRLSATPRCGG